VKLPGIGRITSKKPNQIEVALAGLKRRKKRWKTHRFPRGKSGKTHGVPKNYLQIVDFHGFSTFVVVS
jgi:hypothetical protein